MTRATVLLRLRRMFRPLGRVIGAVAFSLVALFPTCGESQNLRGLVITVDYIHSGRTKLPRVEEFSSKGRFIMTIDRRGKIVTRSINLSTGFEFAKTTESRLGTSAKVPHPNLLSKVVSDTRILDGNVIRRVSRSNDSVSVLEIKITDNNCSATSTINIVSPSGETVERANGVTWVIASMSRRVVSCTIKPL